MKTSRLKKVSVTFAGDDNVVQHIVPLEEKKTTRKKHRSQTYSSGIEGKRKKSKDAQISEESSGDDDVLVTPCTLEADEGLMLGSEVFNFRTPKKSGQMALKASEVKTPKSVDVSSKSTPVKTPKSKGTTPGKKRVMKEAQTPNKTDRNNRRPEATTPYRLRKRNIDGDTSSDDSITSESDSDDSNISDKPSKINQKQTSSRRKNIPTEEMTTNAEDYFDIHSGGAITSDRTLSKLETPRLDHEALNKLLINVSTSHPIQSKEMIEDHAVQFSRWMFNMCNGFNVLLYGLGSKRALLEEFRKSHIADFNHVVVNGYFPSLTIKHVSTCIMNLYIPVYKSSLQNFMYS
ncbi:origin recognition complex subunit 2 [Patella vulgata]|uniref:origin recognition complex subunit 2 n=1 Tax=Patella vulgata TaxID=6465 RepID=UPI0024A93B38|nr:origin recognition complex subunit 2 [Patella vulgata]